MINPLLGLNIISNPYIPIKQPTKREMFKWMYWDSESPKPTPTTYIYIIGGRDAYMRPQAYARLEVELGK